MEEQPIGVFLLELFQSEVLASDGEDGRVELPSVDGYLGVEFEDDSGGGSGAESEDSEGSRGEERRECGEDVVVGVGEGFEEEGDAVDVAGGVEEEEAGASEGVVGGAGDLEDSDVVVPRFEFRQDFHVFGWDSAVFIGGGGGIGGGLGMLVTFEMSEAVAAVEKASAAGGRKQRREVWAIRVELGGNLCCC